MNKPLGKESSTDSVHVRVEKSVGREFSMVSVWEIKRQSLVQDIDERDLAHITKALLRQSFKAGEYLYRENTKRKGLYLIHTGKVEVSNTGVGGLECTLFFVGPGDFCGTLVVFGDESHETNAMALEDTEAFLFPRKDFEALETHDVVAAYQIFKNLARIFSVNSLNMSKKIVDLYTTSYGKLLRDYEM